MPNNCFIPGCKTGLMSDLNEKKSKGEKPTSLFKGPKDPAIFQLWQRAIPRTDRLLKPSDYICAKHFKKEDFILHQEPLKLFDGSVYLHMYKRPRLKKDAVPSIFVDVPCHSTRGLKKNSCAKNNKCRKGKCHCAVTEKLIAQKALSSYSGIEITESRKECFSTKEKENVLKTDLSLLPQVILNCLTPEPHTVLATLNKPTHSVEKVNFSNKSSNSSFHLNMKNNVSEECEADLTTNSQEIVQLSKSQNKHSEATLNTSSDPNDSIELFAILQPLNSQKFLTTEPDEFPETSDDENDATVDSELFPQPSNSTTETETTHQHSLSNFTEPQVSFANVVDSEANIDLPSDTKNKFSFNFLKANAHRIKKINSWWSINSFDDFIICARWNSDSEVERKVIVYKDLKIKIILKEKETTIGNDIEAVSIATISNLIYRVERLRLCRNILNKEGNCLGFLQSYFICKRKNICLNCIKWEKEKIIEEKQRRKERRKANRGKVDLIRFYIST